MTKRFQFGLRWLFMMIGLVALPLGWLGSVLHENRKEQRAIAELQRSGWLVHYELASNEREGSFYNWNKPRPSRFFQHVDAVLQKERPATDDDLLLLCYLPKLKFLTVDEAHFSDAALKRLKGLRQLWFGSDALVAKYGIALPQCYVYPRHQIESRCPNCSNVTAQRDWKVAVKHRKMPNSDNSTDRYRSTYKRQCGHCQHEYDFDVDSELNSLRH